MLEPSIDLSTQLAAELSQRNWGLFGSQGYVLGIDMGSYGLRAILAQLSGNQCYHRAVELRADATAESVLADSFELARGVLGDAGISADSLLRIGVGFSGPVDARSGETLRSMRMSGWNHMPVRQRFEDAFGASTLLLNDASVIALGEAIFGVGRHVPNLFYMHLSRGVGGGVVIQHKLYHGTRTLAGEIGHAPMAPLDGPPCDCGGRGHLESYVSVYGLLRRAAELGLRTEDLRQVFADQQAGRQTIDEAVRLLSYQLAGVVQLLDPQMIILGGIVTRLGGQPFISSVQEAVHALQPPGLERNIPVEASSLGYDAVAIGALALALESLSS